LPEFKLTLSYTLLSMGLIVLIGVSSRT